jgi:hypothetical protein
LNITGSPITTSGTINIGFNGTSGQYINGAGNLTTFPSLTGYVPYSGATQSVILGEWGLRSGYLSLDTTPTGTPTTVGTMAWDTTYLTPSVITGTGNTTLQIGQEEVVLIHNNTGSTLTDGQVVYINGSTGNLPTVALADASDESTSAATLGVVTETIANGSDGFITISGNVNGLNTTAYTAGDILWLSETAGQFTNVKPISPAHLVLIGYVVKVSGGNGSILVKIQNTQELEECSDVLFTSLTNNDVLAYESSTDLWKNKSIPTVLGYTPLSGGGTAGNIPYYTGTYTLGSENGFMYDSSTNRLGVNTTTPNATIGANCAIDSNYGLLVKNGDSNYNGLGFAVTSNYGNLIEAQKIGSAPQRNLTLLNNAGYISVDGTGNLGVNILTPVPGPAGIGGTGIDIYSGSSTAASIGFHTINSGTTSSQGAYLSLNSANSFILRNSSGGVVVRADGDLVLNTFGYVNLTIDSATGKVGIGNPASISEMLTVNGSIRQTGSISGMVKTNSSGVFLNAVAGTDYVAPSELSNYVPSSRTITINGNAQDLSSDRAWTVGNITGSGSNGRVAFWDSGSNITNNALFVWDDVNYRMGIGLSNPQRKLEIYSPVADTHLRISGSAPSVSMGEAVTGSVYQAKFGLATANNQFVTGSVAGDFVINNQTGATIWAYNSIERMRLDTNGNMGIGGIAGSSYRLNVFAASPAVGIESTGTGNMFLRFLQTGDVKGSLYWINADSTLYLSNNYAGIKFVTSGANPALTIASTGAATFSSSVTAITALFNTTTRYNSEIVGIQITDSGSVSAVKAALRVSNNGSGYIPKIILTDNNIVDATITMKGGGTAATNYLSFGLGSSYNILNVLENGNVGIGTTSPERQLHVVNSAKIESGIYFNNTLAGSGAFLWQEANESLRFGTNNTERMRITSGGDLILAQGGTYIGYCYTGGTYGMIIQNTSNNTSATAVLFRGWNNSTTGSIATYVNLTTYNTSSDYRLKEDLKEFTGLDIVSKLKMYDFKWKEADWRMYGGLAHEIAEVVPYAVNGEKDAVDEEGNIKAQGVDYSTLVPLLIKAIQEQQEQINQLKSLINK